MDLLNNAFGDFPTEEYNNLLEQYFPESILGSNGVAAIMPSQRHLRPQLALLTAGATTMTKMTRLRVKVLLHTWCQCQRVKSHDIRSFC